MFARLKTWLGLNQYVSPLDTFLQRYNHPKRTLTPSEQCEVEKHKRLAEARDQAIAPSSKPAGFDQW